MGRGIAADGAAPVIPVIAEVEIVTLAAFAVGLLLGYLVEIRRRNRRW